jgi:hypothetical protein
VPYERCTSVEGAAQVMPCDPDPIAEHKDPLFDGITAPGECQIVDPCYLCRRSCTDGGRGSKLSFKQRDAGIDLLLAAATRNARQSQPRAGNVTQRQRCPAPVKVGTGVIFGQLG